MHHLLLQLLALQCNAMGLCLCNGMLSLVTFLTRNLINRTSGTFSCI